MLTEELKKALKDFKAGRIDEKEIEACLVDLPYENLEFAKIDHHRAIRHGFPEVVFGQNKTTDQTAIIARHILNKNPNVLITRTSEDVYNLLKSDFPESTFHELSGIVSDVKHFVGQAGINKVEAEVQKFDKHLI